MKKQTTRVICENAAKRLLKLFDENKGTKSTAKDVELISMILEQAFSEALHRWFL